MTYRNSLNDNLYCFIWGGENTCPGKILWNIKRVMATRKKKPFNRKITLTLLKAKTGRNLVRWVH